MNSKKAKAIRRSIGYRPTDERRYTQLHNRVVNDIVDGKQLVPGTIVNANSPRAAYLAAKKAAK